MYQPEDLNQKSAAMSQVVTCTACEAGTFADKIYDTKEFNKIPNWLKHQKCQAITPRTSENSCDMH